MSIEQTNQLILLILNSALMMMLSAGLLGGAWLRQNTLSQQLHQAKSRYQRLTHSHGNTDASEFDEPDHSGLDSSKAHIKASLKRVRDHRLQLNHQYQWSHRGMLMLHTALIVFGSSLLALSLRSLFDFDSLIVLSLILFTLGSAGLIAGSGCILVDLAQGSRQNGSLGRPLGRLIHQLAVRSQRKNLPRAQK